MYEGQITVLLGHNGAGKTTTMSMLTGMPSVVQHFVKSADKYYTHHPNVPKCLMDMTSNCKNVKLTRFISCIFELF